MAGGSFFRLMSVALIGALARPYFPTAVLFELATQVLAEGLSLGGSLLCFEALGRLRRRSSGGWPVIGAAGVSAGHALLGLLSATDRMPVPSHVPVAWGLAGALLFWAYVRACPLQAPPSSQARVSS